MYVRRLRLWAAAALVVAIAAGCGGSSDDAAEVTPEVVTAEPAPIFEPASPGDVVRPGSKTPPAVAKAIDGPQVVVVAFLLRGAADDDVVRQSLGSVRLSPVGRRGVRYFVYDVAAPPRFGDLPEVLGVTETPTVAVIGRDRTLTNRWVGLVDAAILRQSVADAKAAPRAPAVPPEPAGVAG